MYGVIKLITAQNLATFLQKYSYWEKLQPFIRLTLKTVRFYHYPEKRYRKYSGRSIKCRVFSYIFIKIRRVLLTNVVCVLCVCCTQTYMFTIHVYNFISAYVTMLSARIITMCHVENCEECVISLCTTYSYTLL